MKNDFPRIITRHSLEAAQREHETATLEETQALLEKRAGHPLELVESLDEFLEDPRQLPIIIGSNFPGVTKLHNRTCDLCGAPIFLTLDPPPDAAFVCSRCYYLAKGNVDLIVALLAFPKEIP